jgi:tetratricopeptide (TPR) repeat protein
MRLIKTHRKRTVLILLIFIFLEVPFSFLFAQPGGREECSTVQLQRAEGAYNVGDFVQAKNLARRLLRCPDLVSSQAQQLLTTIETRERSNELVGQAYLAIRQKQFQEACNLLRRVQESDPNHPTLTNLIVMAGGCSDFEKELEQARSLINQRRWERALNALRVVEESAPDYAGLQELLQAARKGQEEERNSLYERAQRLIAERRFQEARDVLLRLQNAHPNYRDVAQLLKDLQSWIHQAEPPPPQQPLISNEQQTLQKEEMRLISDVRFLVEQREYLEARKKLASIPYLPGGELEDLRNQIDSGLSQEQEDLLSALDLFYEGDYDGAESRLSEYFNARRPAQLRAVARFYLSLTHASRFLLTGHSDEAQRQAAIETYEDLLAEFPGFQPQWDSLSGRVREFYDNVRP